MARMKEFEKDEVSYLHALHTLHPFFHLLAHRTFSSFDRAWEEAKRTKTGCNVCKGCKASPTRSSSSLKDWRGNRISECRLRKSHIR